MMGRRIGRAAFWVGIACLYLFLLASPLVVIYYSFGPTVVLSFPPAGLTLRWYEHAFAQPRLVAGLWTSLAIASIASTLALAIGVPAAYALMRSTVPGRAALSGFFLSPLSLPGLVLAIGLLMFIVSIVQPLTSLRLVGALPPLLGAHLIITLPWVIRTVAASLQTMDRAPEEAARTLGASGLQTFFLVTLPMIWPGVVAAGTFAFIVSFGNFILSLFFTSADIVTLPVAIFQYVDQFQDPTVAAISAVVVATTTIVVVAAYQLGAFLGGRRSS